MVSCTGIPVWFEDVQKMSTMFVFLPVSVNRSAHFVWEGYIIRKLIRKKLIIDILYKLATQINRPRKSFKVPCKSLSHHAYIYLSSFTKFLSEQMLFACGIGFFLSIYKYLNCDLQTYTIWYLYTDI